MSDKKHPCMNIQMFYKMNNTPLVCWNLSRPTKMRPWHDPFLSDNKLKRQQIGHLKRWSKLDPLWPASHSGVKLEALLRSQRQTAKAFSPRALPTSNSDLFWIWKCGHKFLQLFRWNFMKRHVWILEWLVSLFHLTRLSKSKEKCFIKLSLQPSR